MLLIFSKVLVVFIYIGVGFIANKLKVLPEDSVKHFKPVSDESNADINENYQHFAENKKHSLYSGTFEYLQSAEHLDVPQSIFIHALRHCRVQLKVCMLAFCRKILCREFYHIIEAGGTYVDLGNA